MLPNCTKQSVVYENVCHQCVPSARGEKELREEELQGEQPVLYVGESSRSITERSREHWTLYKKGGEDSHIAKHQELVHGGGRAEFTMRLVGSYRSALSRQIGEAIRIRRRGGLGSILNSKSEYNRCHIPRLRVEDKDEEEEREQRTSLEQDRLEEELSKEQTEWEKDKTRSRDKERRQKAMKIGNKGATVKGAKRTQKTEGSKAAPSSKRRKYALLGEDWGELPSSNITGEQPNQERSLNDLVLGSSSEGQNGGEPPPPPPPPPSTTAVVEEDGGGFDTNPIARSKLTQPDIRSFLGPSGSEDRATDSPYTSQGDAVDRRIMIVEDQECDKDMGIVDNGMENTILMVTGQAVDVQVLDSSILDMNTAMPTTPSVGEAANLYGGSLVNDDLSVCKEDQVMNRECDEMKYEECSMGDTSMKSMRNTECDRTSMNVDGEASNDAVCTFNKKGFCYQHKIKGDALRTKTKVWKKKKFGYGWLTTTVVSYTCSGAGMTPKNSIGLDGTNRGRSPDSANSKGDLHFIEQPGNSIGGGLEQD